MRRGDVLWERGEAAGDLVLVRRGHLRLAAPSGPHRTERTTHVVGPWEMAGEEALLPATVRRYRAVAGEVAAIQWLDARTVTSTLKTSRVTREAFLAAWLDDLHDLAHVSAGSGHLDAGGRLASVLLRLARRLTPTEGGEPTIPLQLTHRTLADLAGLHRSTVTTRLNDWLYRGWIADAEPGLRLEDPRTLQRLAGLPDDPAGPADGADRADGAKGPLR